MQVHPGDRHIHPTEEDVEELVRLLLMHDASVSITFIDSLRQRGVGTEVICLELLSPAARLLGVYWNEDRCTFMQVTVALSRLHGVLRALNPAFRTPGFADSREKGRRALLIPTPGEQHTFGLLMVGEFMRRTGWEVWTDFPGTHADAAGLVAGHWFAVVGLTLGSETRLDELKGTIQAVRRESRNPAVNVMVGGPLFVSNPEYVTHVGADAVALDARQATQRAEDAFARVLSVN